MDKFIERALNRRSIRAFKESPVEKETLDILLEAMLKSATSNIAQQASVIRITDPNKKKQISEISHQEYIAKVPELLIFISDLHRNMHLLKAQGLDIEERKSDADAFLQSITDAALMAQNAANIAESLGLGTVFLGSILNDSEKLIEILELPELTFPVLGLAFGYPDQDPPVKPKLERELRVFENTYTHFDDYKETLSDFNEVSRKYYEARGVKEAKDFFKHISFSFTHPKELRNKVFEIAKKNGYKL